MGILNNPKVMKMRLEDCKEPLIELMQGDFVLDPVYFRMKYAAVPQMLMREGVLARLREAREILRKRPGCAGWNFKIFDSYRTLQTQEYLFVDYRNRLKFEHPDWSEEQLREAVQIFVSVPSYDPSLPSPHNTGAAVDLTLVDEHGVEVPMGSGFDEFDEVSFTDHYKEGEFFENRRLLCSVMEEAGFVNYEEEWWHFSYGDQCWAAAKGEEKAIYGSMEL